MRIGVDIDGVLNDISAWHLSYGAKYCSDHGIDRGKDLDAYYVKDIFHLTDEERDDFWYQYIFDLIVSIPPRDFAGYYLGKIQALGHKIVLLTARDNQYLKGVYEGRMNTFVKDWLKKNHIPYDELVTQSTDKESTCIEQNIDLMIEDKRTNIEAISRRIPVLCFDQVHNRSLKGENIYRIYSWAEAYDWIRKKTVSSLEII